MKEARILTEDEKRFVREAMGSPFWGIFQQFVEAKIESWDEESENTLSDDIPSILKREQLLGAKKHSKYLIADFENYIKTKSRKQA